MKALFQLVKLLMVYLCLGQSLNLVGQTIQSQTTIYNTPLFTNRSQVADYDADGDLDIICHVIEPISLVWLENTGTDNWPQQTIFDESDASLSVIHDFYLADFDKNGLLDIIYAAGGKNCGIDELVILLKQADGSSIKETLDTEEGFGKLTIGDFDKNGWIDIAAGGQVIQGVNIYLLNGYNISTGFIFNKSKIATTSDFGSIYQFDIIEGNDWEGDGDIDLLVADPTDVVRIYLNDGAGNFTLEYDIKAIDLFADVGGGHAQFVDLNKDGYLDIITNGGFATNDLSFYHGKHIVNPLPFDVIPLNLISEDPVPGLTYGTAIDIADFNNDGKEDLVWQVTDNITGGFPSTNNGGTLNLLLQGENFTFDHTYLEVNWEAENGICNNGFRTEGSEISYGDLDKDGDLDIIFPEAGETSQRLTIFENNNGTFLRKRIYAGYEIGYMTAADIIGDSDYEIIALTERVQHRSGGEIMLFDKNGKKETRLHEKWDVNPLKLEVVDIDNDTDKDVVFIDADNTSLTWLENDGTIQDWKATTIDGTVNGPRDVEVADLDNANGMDIVVSAYDDNILYFYKNKGDGTFTRIRLDLAIQSPFDVEIADIDKDGDLDVIVGTNAYENLLVVYKNDGLGNFSKQVLTSNVLQLAEGEEFSETHVEIVDWDGDDKDDIVVLFYTSYGRAVIVKFSASGSNFQEEEIYSIVLNHQLISSFQYGFINEDNKPDLILSGQDNFFNQPPTSKFYTLLNGTTITLESSEPEIGFKTYSRIDEGYDADGQSEFLFGSRYGDQRIGVIDYYTPCEANLSFQNEAILSGVYSASNQIQVTGGVSINNGANVTLQAGQSVLLQPDFHAKPGATFTARIQTCSASSPIQEKPSQKEKLLVTIPQRNQMDQSLDLMNATISRFNFEVHPNPLLTEGFINYQLEESAIVSIEIFDSMGKRYKTLQQEISYDRGQYQLPLDVSTLPKGMFFLKMTVNGEVSSKKVIVR